MQEHMKNCPIENSFMIMGKKFSVLILRNMMHYGQTRFNQFLKIKDINAKILSARLKEMEKDGLIKRQVFHETPVRIEYSLTKKGKALEPILNEMAAFSMQNCAKDVFKDGKVRKIEEVYGYNTM
jgi:DNA-binding HxlR family transcriptional regulator